MEDTRSGSDDKTIRLWDVDTGKNEMTLVGHTAWIESIAFSPDGKTLASGGGDSIILCGIWIQGQQDAAHAYRLGRKHRVQSRRKDNRKWMQ